MVESADQARERYVRALHAMQTGVKMMMELDAKSTTPKHLRVGVNASMVDHAGLVMLLIEKGVITDVEYMTKIADAMEREVALYESEVSLATGANITLR